MRDLIAAFSLFVLCLAPSYAAEKLRVYIGNENANGYLEKDNEQARFPELWGTGYEVERKQIEDGNEWVEIESPITFKKAREFVLRNGRRQSIRKIKSYWLKRSDLVLASDLKRVKEGWSIRYVFFDSGDLIESIVFSPNGEARVLDTGENYQRKWKKGHVFTADGVVVVRYPAPSYDLTYLEAGYDIRNQKIYLGEERPDWFAVQGRFTDPRKPVISPIGECLLDCGAKR